MKKLLFGVIILFCTTLFSSEHPMRILAQDYSVCVILLIIIFVYRNQNSKWKALLAEKERELKQYEEKQLTWQDSYTLLEEEKTLVNTRCEYLQQIISKQEAELKKIKNGEIKIHQFPDKEADLAKSIMKGCELDVEIENFLSPQNTSFIPLTLTTEDFKNFIDFYKVRDEAFVRKLKGKGLSYTNKFICILFRKQMTNAQVASVIGYNPKSLSCAKSRIKRLMHLKGSQPLEELLMQLP